MLKKPTNQGRSQRAEQTLIAYAALEDRMDELAGSALAATLLTDMLADFMHFAHCMSLDFQNCVDVAEMHFEAELAEEGCS
jgi:hypothetical protein